MPDEVLGTLIAHEIAHCFQQASFPQRLNGEKSVEEDAVEIVNDWGFNSADITQWCGRHAEERLASALRSLREVAAPKERSPRKTARAGRG
jgi:hypothetical protein